MGCIKIIAAGLHLASWHADPGFNNVNPGAYVRTECNVVVGAFYNSEERTSVYAGYVLSTDIGPVQPTLLLGGATGYDFAPISPLISPGVGVNVAEGVMLRVAYLPKFADNMTHTLHAAVEFRF